MSSSTVSTPSVSSSSERFIGRVKWFNNKSGYGFITVTDGVKSGSDVFVHHSSIKVDDEQYKYLVQGEYVNFKLLDTTTDRHEYQAGEVCGIKGGKLMCETRRESRVARSQYNTNKNDVNYSSEPVKMPRHVAAPRETTVTKSRAQGNRENTSEWKQVSRSRNPDDNTSKTQPRDTGGREAGGREAGGRGAGGRGRGRGRPPKSTRE
jgi:CspA family cold shock protein